LPGHRHPYTGPHVLPGHRHPYTGPHVLLPGHRHPYTGPHVLLRMDKTGDCLEAENLLLQLTLLIYNLYTR
jgi:hypothetical protein